MLVDDLSSIVDKSKDYRSDKDEEGKMSDKGGKFLRNNKDGMKKIGKMKMRRRMMVKGKKENGTQEKVIDSKPRTIIVILLPSHKTQYLGWILLLLILEKSISMASENVMSPPTPTRLSTQTEVRMM